MFSGLTEEAIQLLKNMWITKLKNLGSLDIEPEVIEPEAESCDENVLAQSEASEAAQRSTGAISKKKLRVNKPGPGLKIYQNDKNVSSKI